MQLKMCFNLNYVICILDTIHYILYCNIYYAIVVLHAKDIKIFSYTAATICYNQGPCYNVLLLLKANRTICNVFNSRLIANCTFSSGRFLIAFPRILAVIWMVHFVRLPALSLQGLSSNILLRLDLKRLSTSNCIKLSLISMPL